MPRRQRPTPRKSRRRGSVLLETVLAVFIMSAAGLALIGMVQQATIVAMKSREQQDCGRLVQSGFARLKNIDFYYLFAADSSLADHGLWSGYPYAAVLQGLAATLSAARFDRFTTEVVFMRRDGSDADGDGQTTDLIAFTDANSDLVDDYDSAIRYFDQNLNGNYWQTYTSGGRTIAEQPDTHIKRVTLKVYRRGRVACAQTELVSLEQFLPSSNPSSESVLSLLVTVPPNNAFLYEELAAEQIASRALSIAKSFPGEVTQRRADSASPLPFEGETDPLATIKTYVGSSSDLDALAADASGAFSGWAVGATAALVEGTNLISAQATKSSYSSPITARQVILDVQPPTASSVVPAGTVNTRAPFVSLVLTDAGVSTTVVSGVCPDVLTLSVNGSSVPFSYDAASGKLVWLDAATNTVPVLNPGAYAAVVEFGDYSGYKGTHTWTFTISVPDTDHSAPSIADRSPIGMAGSQLPVISVRVFDNQSGIDPLSIVLTIDGVPVVGPGNIGSHYDAETGTISYTPSAPFSSGSNHNVSVAASHFAGDPVDKVASSDAWSFSIP